MGNFFVKIDKKFTFLEIMLPDSLVYAVFWKLRCQYLKTTNGCVDIFNWNGSLDQAEMKQPINLYS